MARKQAMIAVRSGLSSGDEQYGCVVPPIHFSSTYNFTSFNQPRAYGYSHSMHDAVQRAFAELKRGAESVINSSGMSVICQSF
ncbi:MAG: PLP-dependent transferase [Symbiopectobacterium sp.]